MDDADRADTTIAHHLLYALSRRAQQLVRTGLCAWCEEPARGAFCCVECRDDYAAAERADRIAGRPDD